MKKTVFLACSLQLALLISTCMWLTFSSGKFITITPESSSTIRIDGNNWEQKVGGEELSAASATKLYHGSSPLEKEIDRKSKVLVAPRMNKKTKQITRIAKK